LWLAVLGRRSGKLIIDEHHPMSDEDFIFNHYPFANKGVRRYLAPRTNIGTNLYLNECTNPSLIADNAIIQIDQVGIMDSDLSAELDVLADRHSNSSFIVSISDWRLAKAIPSMVRLRQLLLRSEQPFLDPEQATEHRQQCRWLRNESGATNPNHHDPAAAKMQAKMKPDTSPVLRSAEAATAPTS
jgi:hypothetical protein